MIYPSDQIDQKSYAILNGREHYKVYEIYVSPYRNYFVYSTLVNNYVQICNLVWENLLISGIATIASPSINFEYITMPSTTDELLNNRFKDDMRSFKNEATLLFYHQLMSLNLVGADNKIPVELYHKETTTTYHILGGYIPKATNNFQGTEDGYESAIDQL
jgi:hypothetical protein